MFCFFIRSKREPLRPPSPRRRWSGNVRNFSKTTEYGRKGGPRARTSRVLRRTRGEHASEKDAPRILTRSRGRRTKIRGTTATRAPATWSDIFCRPVPRRLRRLRRDFYCVYGVNAAPSRAQEGTWLYLVKALRLNSNSVT